MSAIIDFLNSHGSARQFQERDITADDELLICKTAQRSPTSFNLQAYSIISVRNRTTKKTLAELCGGQDHVSACPLFLVFCADLHRQAELNKQRRYPCHADTVEMFMVATIDATLAASRALMAAQALGMGGVMVGSIRDDPDKTTELLALPELVYPVMGMSLGYPVKAPAVKPRLPIEAVRFVETYGSDKADAAIEEYDKTFEKTGYLSEREVEPEKYPGFSGVYSWTEHSARRLASESSDALRQYMMSYLRKQGFIKR